MSEPSGLSLNIQAFGALGPEQVRQRMPGFLSGFISDAAASGRNRARLQELVDTWSDESVQRLLAVLVRIGDEPRLYEADPSMRVVTRAFAQDVVLEPQLEGADHLRAAIEAGPVVIVCNHLSYFDSNAIDAILSWSGHSDLANRIASAAGPKVYQDVFRRVAAACLNTLPVPQSNRLSHTAEMRPRELARLAKASVAEAARACGEGFVPLIYPEGSRTRDGRMQPFLHGVRRYLGMVDGIRVVPAAIVGPERIMPVGRRTLEPAPVSLCFGRAIEVGGAYPPRAALAASHDAISALLPEAFRPSNEVKAP